MPKLLHLSLALCLGLSGCQVFRKSQTWDKVTRVRTNTMEAADPSQTYADELHRVLEADAVEHKVVTYQYRYTTRLRETAVATRTAVIYRDNHHPSYPWWLMDERTGTPVWLPNGDVQRQVQFYVQSPTEVVAMREFPDRGNSGKSVVELESALSPSLVKTGTSSRRVAGNEKQRRLEFLRARVATAPDQQVEAPLEKRFRSIHGSKFNPASAVDRQKMAMLRGMAFR